MNDDSTKVVLVTGAGQRIGAHLARVLHQRGYRVLLHYRSSDSAAVAVAAEFNRVRADSSRALQADLTDLAQVQRLAEQVVEIWGRLDALINNASSYFETPWGNTGEAEWDALIGSNLKGPYFLTQALLPLLAEQRGAVINLIDVFAERPAKNFSVYCAAKAGLAMLTRSLALDWGDRVRVNGIAPGVILWPEQPVDHARKAATLDRVPQGRIGSPDDIAKTALFLLDDAPYINGQIVAVDGGYSLT